MPSRWNPRAESNRRSTGFVIRCLSAWLRGCGTASLPGRGPSRRLAFARVAPRRRLRIARLAVNARLWVIVVNPAGGEALESSSRDLQTRARPSQLTPDGGVGVSRTRWSPSRLVDVADRCLTVRPPLRMRSRRGPSRSGDAALPRSQERVRQLNEHRRAPVRRARTSRENFGILVFSFQRTRQTGRARPCTQDTWGDRRDSHSLQLASRASASICFGFNHHAGPGRIERPSRGLESRSSPRRGPQRNEKGPAARRSPRRAYRSIGATVTMRRPPSLGACRPTRTSDRSGNSNPRSTICGLRFGIGRMRIAAS